MGSIENDIQYSIVEFLRSKKIFCWRNNTTGVYDPVSKNFRRPGKHTLSGIGDILGVLPNGKFLTIEVKTKTGTVSENQKTFMANVKNSNGIAFVARSIEDVERELKSIV